MTRGTAEIVFPAALLAACAALWPHAAAFPPESRIFPATLLVLLAGLSVLLMARAWRRPPADAGTAFFEHAGRFALALAMIVAYLAALPHAGFFTASAALALAMPFVLGYRDLPRLGLAGAIFLAAVWAIFVWIFQRPLPREFFLAS